LITNQLLAQTMQNACLGHVPFDTSAAIYNDTVADRGEQSGDCPAALLPRGRCALSAKRLRETWFKWMLRR
jgi:hypothetical protein